MGERFMLVSVDSLTLGSIIIDTSAVQTEPPAWCTRFFFFDSLVPAVPIFFLTLHVHLF